MLLPFYDFLLILKYHLFSTHFQNPKTKFSIPNQEHITREIFLFSCIHTEVADENYIVDYQREGGYSIMIERQSESMGS
jgi:hypothetical protein